MSSHFCYTVVTLYILVLIARAVHGERAMVPLDTRQGSQQPIVFSSSWQVLGPFQIGTREATWGSDPLEYLGGFRALQYDQGAQFRSSLGTNGTAKWALLDAKQTTSTPNSTNASLSISYPDVDWVFLRIVYGWAAVQYQAWARGEIVVNAAVTQHVILYTDMALEFWVDDVHYFGGDFYAYRKAPPVLHLSPGSHKIDVRLIRDVRAMGGVLEPTIDVVLELQQTSGSLELAKPGVLMADVVDGKLASSIGSIALRNSGEDDIEIVDVQSSDTNNTLLNDNSDIIVAAGQTRPVAFNISLRGGNSSSLNVAVIYKPVKVEGQLSSLNVSQNLAKRSLYDPHKITYLHPGGMVSYAMLRPPARNATCRLGQNISLPVLLQLHGAGLEAENEQVAHALDPVSDLCAWVMFPTGVTPWSGDDWHNWGFADVEYAVNSIPSWIKTVGWQGPGVDIGRWVVSGHSNGGQGTWYSLTHQPDRIIAAAPVSGYASIQKYVPYELWQPMDPRRSAIVSGSLNSYRHEMLMENAKGIPILQQHGEKDDNVPTYHSRFLGQLLFQAGAQSNYYELPGQGHWFDSVMTTSQLKDFYRKQTATNMTDSTRLKEFTFIVADPGDMGRKGGIRVTHLEDPGQYGRVGVKYDSALNSYIIRTSNILGLQLSGRYSEKVDINGQELVLPGESTNEDGSNEVCLTTEGTWKVGSLHSTEADVLYRRGRQLGAMTAILRTRGPFIISHQGNQTSQVALQVSRNLHQYFSADSKIVGSASWDNNGTGNVITIATGESLPPSTHPNFPIQVGATSISVRDSEERQRTFEGDARLGAAFLRPLQDERLELVIWGSDGESLAQAARLVPMLTGVGQPDFVILGESARWRGVEGAMALGFLNHAWNVTASSLV
ncbi:hypothetical protein K469DRAFT_220618 [Zopfia rhizophila CBS 207.26]|uniref:Peptidase S9 prolyl oligopeptidase catalytic domain-containing protein n=1 Tax=Zopfia rhizophila CBS 207.26 TaxID=1314779 RepID=A0A6A6DT49_9PEZI|nr:hypothetical protein K469DRAFT_220618 [Zopfia rhizophila CBS 207.26]